MKIDTTRFGSLEYRKNDIINFEDGLVGFHGFRQFLLLAHKPGSPFQWLQSVEEPSLAFLVVNPFHYVPHYDPHIRDEDAHRLGIEDATPRFVLTTCAIPAGVPEEMTLNLAGPIVVNAATRMAKQVVLEGNAYTVKHRVFRQAHTERQEVAA